ncbi:MAG: DUF2652 domain-containing protein [Alphaproteobacteria bacterium]|nr:DUF2652 domain-containing protein [Alphaproteobacteria bacterium]
MSESEYGAYLVLTDISGYTPFVKAHAEVIRHAQYAISELLGAVLAVAEPPLVPAKLEGDAVFFQAPDGGPADGLAVGRSLTRFFDAFYARRDAMVSANSCHCQACAGLGAMELKTIAHRGPIHSYRLGGFDELAGFDIIVAHRLLKNGVGGRRYLLVTEAAWPGLGLSADRARPHREDYADVGPVDARLLIDGLGPPPGETPPPAGPAARLIEALRKGLGWRLRSRIKGE